MARSKQAGRKPLGPHFKILLRIPEEDLRGVDIIRGKMNRSEWFRAAIAAALAAVRWRRE